MGEIGSETRDVSQSSGLGSYDWRGHQRIPEVKKHRRTLHVTRDIRVLRYCWMQCVVCDN